jgi:GAF domain-containing protein
MTRKLNSQERLKAAMRVLTDLFGSASDEDMLNDIRETGEEADKVVQQVTDLFEAAFSPPDVKPLVEHTAEHVGSHVQFLQRIRDSGLLPCPGSFDAVWNCIVKALHGLGIDRVRLYLLSEDGQFLFAVDHWGMGKDFVFQRRAVRDEPHWALLASDRRLHVFQREAGKHAPFEEGVAEEVAAREWFCQLLTWNGKIVGKLSGDCKNSGRKLVAEDLHAIELFAPLLGSAIGHARLLSNLGSVLRVSSSAMTCDTPTDIMVEVCRAACEISGVDHSSVLLFDTHDPLLGRIEAEYPLWGALGTTLPLHGVPLAKLLAESRAPLVVADAPNELGCGHLRDILAKLEIRSVLLVPIVNSGRLTGSLILDARKNSYKFTDADITLATIYASQVAVAFENQRRRAESEALMELHQAIEDMLIPNEFDVLAELIADRARSLFEARFAVFCDCRRDRSPSEGIGVFCSGIAPPEWMAIEQHGPSQHRLLATVQERAWVEIANVLDPNQMLPGLRLPEDLICFQGIALKTSYRVEGLLFLGYSRPAVFTTEQRHAARKFAAFAALSLQRTHVISAMNRSRTLPAGERLEAHVSALQEANRIITSGSRGLKPPETLDHILKQAIECTAGKDSLRNTIGSIWVFDSTSNILTLVSTYPRGLRPIGYTLAILEEFGRIGITGRAVLKKAPQRVSNVRNDEDYIQLNPLTCSELAVPILKGDTVLGVLNLESDREDAFGQLDEDTVMALADLAAIVIQNSIGAMLAPALQP